jgi:hypothetical protein
MGSLSPTGALCRKETFYVLNDFLRSARRMHYFSQLAAVPHSVRKPARELLHFSHAIGQVRVKNFLIVARK